MEKIFESSSFKCGIVTTTNRCCSRLKVREFRYTTTTYGTNGTVTSSATLTLKLTDTRYNFDNTAFITSASLMHNRRTNELNK